MKTSKLFLFVFTLQSLATQLAWSQTESSPAAESQLTEEAQTSVETDEQLASIFATEAAKMQRNLGIHCKYSSLEEAQAGSATNDPDLKMTEAEFAPYFQAAVGLPPSFHAGDSIKPNTAATCFMSVNELASLRAYTASWYRHMNQAMRSKDKVALQKFRLVIKFLISALGKLKDYVGYVKRGTYLSADGLSILQPGQAHVYNAFTSTSTAGGFGGNTRYVIYSRTCKYIDPLSSAKGEQEVLCLPGMTFLVRWRKDESGITKVLMEEKAQSFDVDQYIQAL